MLLDVFKVRSVALAEWDVRAVVIDDLACGLGWRDGCSVEMLWMTMGVTC